MRKILLAPVIALAAVFSAHTIAGPEVELTAAYDSKYVSEGRDNLGDGGLIGYEGVASFENGVSVGAWFAYSTDDNVDYEERNYFVEYGWNIGAVETYVGFTHLSFKDGSQDNEIGAGIASTDLPVTLALDYVYSKEAEGGFVEVSLSKGFEASEMGVVVTPYILQAFDYGYATEENDGANHTQIGVGISKEVAMNVTVGAHLNHSFAGDDVDRDGLDDETWGGLSVSFSF